MTVLRASFVLALASLVVFSAGASAASSKAEGIGAEQGKRKLGKGKGSERGRREGGGRFGLRGRVSKEIMTHLYPVGLVRRHASDLGLTDAQISRLRKAVTKVHADVEGLKWDVERESQKLSDMVKSGAQLQKIYKQMDKVFLYENKIKKKHLGLLITVRDILTTEQRKYLDGVKGARRGGLGGGKNRRHHLRSFRGESLPWGKQQLALVAPQDLP